MPVIYLSPYYSMLDYSLALEGVYGFRHHDRYGGDKAVYMNLRAYEPGSAPLGTAKQPANWMSVYGATLSDLSINWQEGVKFNIGLDLDSREPFTFSQKSVAEIDTTNYQASFTPGSAFQAPADGVYNMRYYQEVDGDAASATQAPGWVEGNQLAATEGAASRMWYSSYDSNLARAAGVEAFPPIGAAGQANSTMWYFGYDSALARATQSPGWVEGNALASADLFKPRNLAEANGDSTNIARVYEGYVPSTAVMPDVPTFNPFENATFVRSASRNLFWNIGSGWLSDIVNATVTGAVAYFEVAISNGNNIFGLTQATSVGASSNFAPNSIPLTTTPTDISAAGDLTFGPNWLGVYSAGDVWSFLLDDIKHTLKVYRNAVLVGNYINVRAGGWRPCGSIQGVTQPFRLQLAQFTLAPALGFILGSPGGPVSGFAVEVGKFPHNAESEAVPNPSLINVAVQMPVSSYPTDPVLMMGKVEDEAERVDDHVQYTGYVPSTAIAPAKTGNAFDGHVLNNGSLTGASSPWNSFWDPVGSTVAAYYELRVDTVSSLVMGFTCGNGYPGNGSDPGTPYYYNGPTGSQIGTVGVGTTNQAATDFVVYCNAQLALTVGDIWSAYVDPAARIIKWYVNGVLRFSINNIPTGKTWKPCFNVNSAQATARFNYASWTKAAACGISFQDGSPGGVVDGLAVDEYLFVKNEDKVNIDQITRLYEGYVPSTAIAPVKFGNPLETATLQLGALQAPLSGGAWYASWSQTVVNSGKAYYEITRDGGTSTAIFGFTTGNGYPNNGADRATQYAGTGPLSGSWLTSGMQAVSVPSAVDYICYPDTFQSMSTGEVWGCLLDLDARTMSFYRNGTFVCGYSNLPLGKTWIPCVQSYSNSILNLRFNIATWTKNPGLSISFSTSSPGGVVSGFAEGVKQPTTAEDELGTILLRVPALDQALLDAITNRINVSDDSVWGSSQKVWASNQLGTVTNRDPSLDQVPENLIWDSRQDVAKNDVWETRNTQLISSMTGVFTAYLPTSDQLDFLNSVARTGVATADSCFKRPAEYVACVDSTQVEPWDYRNETALYPLKVIPTVGLSNTTSITIEG